MRHVDVTLNLEQEESLLKEDIKRLIANYLLQNQEQLEQINVEALTGGITNKCTPIYTHISSYECIR
jgi:hypothetical protein